MRNRVEVFRQIGIYDIGIAPADQPVRFLDRVDRAASRAIAVGAILKVRFEDRLQDKPGGGLNHPIPDRRDTKRAFAAPGFGIITRRTGAARYVFETSSSRRPVNHVSTPAASICAKVIPSTPGAPALARANL